MSGAVNVRAVRQQLREVADQIKAELQTKTGRCLRSVEWSNVPLVHRMAVLLIAGIDGDLSALSRKSWQEFTPGEHESIAVAVRSLHRSTHQCNALRVKA